MEFRPINQDLIIACSSAKLCSECSMRMGCSIRYSFYKQNDIQYEIALQLAEIKANHDFSKLKKNFVNYDELTYETACTLRQKRTDEMKIHPYFSYS